MPHASIALLIGAAVFGGFAAYVRLRRGSPGAASMLFILLAGVEYTLTYAFELNATDPATKQMWGDVKYLGVCLLPAAWFAFTLQYTGRGRWLTRRLTTWLAVEPVAVLLCLAIPAAHDLVHSYPATAERFPLVPFGVVGWANVGYSYALILISTAMFVVTLSRIARPYRRQARFVMASLAIPLALNVAYNFNVGPFGRFDLTAFGFLLTAVVILWGVVRLRLLDIVPVARSVVLETLSDGVVVLDAFHRVVDLNPAAERIIGAGVTDPIGRPIEQLLPTVAPLCEGFTRSRTIDAEVRMGPDPVGRDFEVTVSLLPDAGGRPAGRLVVLRDISDRKLAEERLERLAHYDTLTGLPNRKLFGDRLSQALIRARRNPSPLALLFLDIDDFKDINDTLGHDIGDAVLAELATRVQSCLRAEDTVARQSGDEFTVILPEIESPSDAAFVANRILEAIRRPVFVGDHDIHVTASVGICVWPADGEDPVTLVRNADVAMYRAKAHKDRFEFYATDLSVQAAVRLNLERELRRALDRGELRLFYQPIISMASGRVVALEALIRWQHPTRGLLAPSEFLWRAEETGLIDPIGRWVLEEACAQTRRWTSSRADGSLQVSVNLSARQLLQPSLAEEVGHVLVRTGLHPDALILEISEEAVMGDLLGNEAMLHELKALGVRLALDDFGTGSTALSQLGRFPLDILKIDRIFVDGVDTSSEHAVIVGAMASLADALGLSVVAEGVETPGQMRALRAHGCDLVQGFLFSRPVPPASVPSLLSSPSWARAVAG